MLSMLNMAHCYMIPANPGGVRLHYLIPNPAGVGLGRELYVSCWLGDRNILDCGISPSITFPL